jgi:hypothetical protein
MGKKNKEKAQLGYQWKVSNLAPLNYYKVDSLCKNKKKYPFDFVHYYQKKITFPIHLEFRVLIFQFDLIVFIQMSCTLLISSTYMKT